MSYRKESVTVGYHHQWCQSCSLGAMLHMALHQWHHQSASHTGCIHLCKYRCVHMATVSFYHRSPCIMSASMLKLCWEGNVTLYVAVPGRNRPLCILSMVLRLKHCNRELMLGVGLNTLCKRASYSWVYTVRMSPTRNGSTALQCFECGNALEIHNGIMFDFYLGLPHIESSTVSPTTSITTSTKLWMFTAASIWTLTFNLLVQCLEVVSPLFVAPPHCQLYHTSNWKGSCTLICH